MEKGDYAVFFTARTWGDELSGGGERVRELYSGCDIPACLFCAFKGANLGELERHLLRWTEEGCPERFSIDGKFLRTDDGWREDLEIRPGGGGEEPSQAAVDYSKDFSKFFGPRR